MEIRQREGEEKEHVLPLHKYDNTDDILKGDKETKYISQTLTLLFLSMRNCWYHNQDLLWDIVSNDPAAWYVAHLCTGAEMHALNYSVPCNICPKTRPTRFSFLSTFIFLVEDSRIGRNLLHEIPTSKQRQGKAASAPATGWCAPPR